MLCGRVRQPTPPPGLLYIRAGHAWRRTPAGHPLIVQATLRMVLNFKITSESRPRPEDVSAVENAVYRYNMMLMNDWAFQRVAVFLRDDADRVMGGALGGIWGGWLHLNFLWVTDALRGQGYGSQLLARVEDQARAHQCRGIFLETHSFQALPFYERRGYVVLGELQDYPPGHSFYMMCKRLE